MHTTLSPADLDVSEVTCLRHGFSPSQLASLEATYTRAAQPVWIVDLRAELLYQNPASADQDPSHRRFGRFEITDLTGQPVGHLITEAN